jgi:hypothetical protein
MPVNKRAARPPAASSSDDPRGPQTSENDFTVLFQRVSARMFKPPPAKHTAPVKPATIVPPAMRRAPPGRPSAGRAAPFFPPSAPPEPERSRGRERPTPLVMAMPPVNDEVVTVPPSIRVHLIRISVLLTFGCLLGVGVEVLARGQVVSAGPLEESAHVSSAAAQAPLPAGDDSSLVGLAGHVGAGTGERVSLGPVHHHHHKHHAPSPSSSAVTPPRVSHDGTGATTDDDDDADVDGGDDLSAAMKTLTKAKEEVTIP